MAIPYVGHPRSIAHHPSFLMALDLSNGHMDAFQLSNHIEHLSNEMFKGATSAACKVYTEMKTSPAIQKPLCWTAPSFSLDPYNLIFFPGGHEKSVRQLLDSPIVHQLMADYFPQTQKPSAKNVAAICHGVMVLSESMLSDGKSVLHDVTTTTLPATFEGVAYWGTRAFLGDYYKTYGTCSESTEASV
jgi:putative intracellular protease/amidase